MESKLYDLKLSFEEIKTGWGTSKEEFNFGSPVNIQFIDRNNEFMSKSVFYSGQITDHMKLFIEETHKIPFDLIDLYFNNKILLGILSLSDYPELITEDGYSTIQVRIKNGK